MAQYTLKNFPQGNQMGNFFSGLRGMFGGGENSLFRRTGASGFGFNPNFQMPQGAFGGMFEPKMYSMDSPFKPTATGDIQGQGFMGLWGPQHANFSYNRENKRRQALGLEPIMDYRSGTPITNKWSPGYVSPGAQLAGTAPSAEAISAFRSQIMGNLPTAIRRTMPGDELYNPNAPRPSRYVGSNPMEIKDKEMRNFWIAQYELQNPGSLPNEILKQIGYQRKDGTYVKI